MKILLAKKQDDYTESLEVHTRKSVWPSVELQKNEKINKRINVLYPDFKEIFSTTVACHDFGKSFNWFQDKLEGKKTEALRHEAISFMFMFYVFLKTKQQKYLISSIAILSHHNKKIMIEKASGIKHLKEGLVEFFSGKDSFDVDNSFHNEEYEKTNLSFDKKDILKVYKKFLDKEVLKLMGSFLDELETDHDLVVLRFKQYLRKAVAFVEKDSIEIYSKFLILKSLTKICDEYASNRTVHKSKKKYLKTFNKMVDGLFFFKAKTKSDVCTSLLNKTMTPTQIQADMLEEESPSNFSFCVGGVGSGKSVFQELYKNKMGLNFMLDTTPTRFLAFEKAKKFFDSLEDLVSSKKVRNIPEMEIYHTTTDNIYLTLTGNRREYLFLKLLFGGMVVFDEIDMFQDSGSFYNLSFMLKILSKLKIPTMITTATSTDTLKNICEKAWGEKAAFYPKTEIVNTKVRARISVIKGIKPLESVLSIVKLNLSRRICIYTNSTSSASKYSVELNKLGIPNILYHSKMDTNKKTISRNLLIDLFGKNSIQQDSYPVVIMSPIGEIGVDISFEIMISEASPVRSLQQRTGRLNRWGTFSECVFYIVKDFLCGFGSLKQKGMSYKIAKYGETSVCSYDPYFLADLHSLNSHLYVFSNEFDGKNLGVEAFMEDPKLEEKCNKYKDLWFFGVLQNCEKKAVITHDFNLSIPDMNKDFEFSLAFLTVGYVKDMKDDYLNQCFRKVDARDFESGERKYKAVPNYYFQDEVLKDDYTETEKYGITKKWIFE